MVADLVVDVSFESLGGLCTVAFLEAIDRKIGRSHLFKRSIVLVSYLFLTGAAKVDVAFILSLQPPCYEVLMPLAALFFQCQAEHCCTHQLWV